MKQKINIIVNGQEITTNCENLQDLLEELNYTQEWLASAVNSQLITKQKRDQYRLQENDKIEILSPMQGG